MRLRAPKLVQMAKAGTARPMRQAAPASGPMSRNRASTPDHAMIAEPTSSAIQPIRSSTDRAIVRTARRSAEGARRSRKKESRGSASPIPPSPPSPNVRPFLDSTTRKLNGIASDGQWKAGWSSGRRGRPDQPERQADERDRNDERRAAEDGDARRDRPEQREPVLEEGDEFGLRMAPQHQSAPRGLLAPQHQQRRREAGPDTPAQRAERAPSRNEGERE